MGTQEETGTPHPESGGKLSPTVKQEFQQNSHLLKAILPSQSTLF